VFHQGVYATRDAERWIAITFHTQKQWQAFARSERLADADAGTRASALAAWCAARPGGESVEYLQHEGIAAGEVQDMSDLVERDPQIRARGSLINLSHPLLGEFGHMRTPIDFSRSGIHPYRAPGIGEHNLRIAREICGLSELRVAELERLGVFK
jgi:crotonobetainyl-CoA:carnitine CoA-transferase CaiB-like acyl-CoA transferase